MEPRRHSGAPPPLKGRTMKALILAAGRGTRVQPLTATLPKPMMPIIDKPVLELLVEHLRRHGFDQIIVNTSYLAPQIEDYFRDGSRFGVRMGYSFEGYESAGQLIDQPLGSAGAIRKIQQHSGFFDETFAVLCGDAIIDLDLTELLRQHRAKGALATLALKTVAPEQLPNYGVALRDEHGRILSFQEKPAPGRELSRQANTGIYLFEPEILSWIPAHGSYDIGGQLFVELARAGAPMYGVELPFEWQDIGRLEDYHRVVMAALAAGAAAPRVGLNVAADFSRITLRGPVYIGASASIGDGCTLLGPLVIGAGAVVEPGVHLERCIVQEHTRLGRGASFRDQVIGRHYCIQADGSVLDGRHTDTAWLFRDARSVAAPLSAEQCAVLGAARGES
jgi:mannose-1-phosphate guanylyltransferase